MGHFLLLLKSQNIRQIVKKKKPNHGSRERGGINPVLQCDDCRGEMTAEYEVLLPLFIIISYFLTTHYKTILRIETNGELPIPTK